MKTIYTNITTDEIIAVLKKDLNEERYLHSLGTAEMSAELAKKYNCDEEKAYIAGLLHDCAKCTDFTKSQEIARKYITDITEEEINNRKTIHAPVSAYIAKTKFGVNDNEILSAIRFHTIGKCDMSDFEKIIFIADKIETKTRPEEFRKLIVCKLEEENPLNEAMFRCCELTIESLVKRKLPICYTTIVVYNNLINKIKKG